MVGLGDLQQQYLNQIQGYVTPPTLGAPTLPPPVEVPETPAPTLPITEGPPPAPPTPWESNLPGGGQRGGPDTNPHQHYRYEVGGLGGLFGDGSSGSQFLSSAPGWMGAFGASYGTGFDYQGNAHDIINWDGAGFLGSLVGGFIGIPGVSNAFEWGAEELGIDATQVLGSMGLAGFTVADVLNNPDNFSSRQVAAANEFRDKVYSGQGWQPSDLGSASNPGRMGMVTDAAGKYTQPAGWGDVRAPIPGRRPDALGTASGGKGPVADGTMGSVNKNIGGISSSGGGLGSSGGAGSGGKGNDTSTQSKR